MLRYHLKSVCVCFVVGFLCLSYLPSCQQSHRKERNTTNKLESPIHSKVYYEDGKFAGWPANWGFWSWEDEILVGFTLGDHKEKESHTFDRSTSINMFARSLDGGKSWSLENAYDQGITEATFEHNIGERSEPAIVLLDTINFLDPDFAFTFRMIDLLEGPTSFYYSYDRGKTWQGAFQLNIDFSPREPAGIVSRTDYIIDGKHSMTAFLTVGFIEGEENWREVACVRTEDGGLTWKLLSWISPERVNSIMPGSVRISESKLLCIIRQTRPPEMVSYLSKDNGSTWDRLPNPVVVDRSGNPPALLKLSNGKLCLVYGLRSEETRPDGIGIYVTYSTDEGLSWEEPQLLRGGDGAVWDIGYPRMTQLTDGSLITLYYYNNAKTGDPYRYIASTIFKP